MIGEQRDATGKTSPYQKECGDDRQPTTHRQGSFRAAMPSRGIHAPRAQQEQQRGVDESQSWYPSEKQSGISGNLSAIGRIVFLIVQDPHGGRREVVKLPAAHGPDEGHHGGHGQQGCHW
jgi:hypothetical protein